MLGIVFNGAGNYNSQSSNSNGAKTTITALSVNNIAYAGTLPPAKTTSSNPSSFKVFFDCADGAPVIITGTAEFQWKNGVTTGNNDRPFVYFALGEPEVRPTLACPPRRCLESCLQPQKSPLLTRSSFCLVVLSGLRGGPPGGACQRQCSSVCLPP